MKPGGIFISRRLPGMSPNVRASRWRQIASRASLRPGLEFGFECVPKVAHEVERPPRPVCAAEASRSHARPRHVLGLPAAPRLGAIAGSPPLPSILDLRASPLRQETSAPLFTVADLKRRAISMASFPPCECPMRMSAPTFWRLSRCHRKRRSPEHGSAPTSDRGRADLALPMKDESFCETSE